MEHTTRIMSVLLLAVFTFVILPRDLWHHHNTMEHLHKQGSNHLGSELFASDDCPICDFQLLPYHFHLSEVSISTPADFSTKLFYFYESLLLSAFQDIAARGPPTNTVA